MSPQYIVTATFSPAVAVTLPFKVAVVSSTSVAALTVMIGEFVDDVVWLAVGWESAFDHVPLS